MTSMNTDEGLGPVLLGKDPETCPEVSPEFVKPDGDVMARTLTPSSREQKNLQYLMSHRSSSSSFFEKRRWSISIGKHPAARGKSILAEMRSQRSRSHFLKQILVLLHYQTVADIKENLTFLKLVEIYGVALLTGLVFFQKGQDETGVGLVETTSLIFFSTALFTPPIIFQSLVKARKTMNRFEEECMGGLYPVWTGVVVMHISAFLIFFIQTSVWQIATYALADLGANVRSIALSHLTLAVNAFTMYNAGLLLGCLVPAPEVNVVVGNLIAQSCMLSNGFYTKLSDWLQWITYFSVPRYTFQSLIKLEYAWKDSFAVHPMSGFGARGSPMGYIPAEATPFFGLMKFRGMNMMQSPLEGDITEEIAKMLLGSSALAVLFVLVLSRRLAACEV